MLSVRIGEMHVTVNNIKMLIIGHKCFDGEFMSPATINPTQVFMYSSRFESPLGD